MPWPTNDIISHNNRTIVKINTIKVQTRPKSWDITIQHFYHNLIESVCHNWYKTTTINNISSLNMVLNI